jgi:CRISPR system Cascade subunit CasA
MPSFNLLDERWIPCTWLADDRHENLSIREVLAQAHAIRELYDPSPLVTVALHRLLLAILHRNFGPRNLDTWCALWQRGQWDMTVLDAYFDTWRHRFDLFDGERPFYQVTFMLDAKHIHPAQLLPLEMASGNNPTLFDHHFNANPADFTPVEAARSLIARQAFSPGGGNSTPFNLSSSPLTTGYSVLAVGNSLFETLMLNLLVYNQELPVPWTGTDAPIWEQEVIRWPTKEGTVPFGYLDYLTWQSRRVHLLVEKDAPIVRHCQLQQNHKLPEGQIDPFKAYERSKKEGEKAMGFRPDRALWRDSHTLFRETEQLFRRPDVFNWLARINGLRKAGKISAQAAYRFAAFGFTSEPGKIAKLVLWRHEHLPLPLDYLSDAALQEALRIALALANDMGALLEAPPVYAVRASGRAMQVPSPVRILAETLIAPLQEGEKPDGKDVSNLLHHLTPARQYWARLEVLFASFLVELANDSHVDGDSETQFGRAALPNWWRTIQAEGQAALKNTTRSLDTTARALKAVARAEQEFRYRVRDIESRHNLGGWFAQLNDEREASA